MSTRVLIDHRAGGVVRHPEKANRAATPALRKPDWIRVRAPSHPVYQETRALMREHGLVTVCEEAACPNIGECWSQRHATMMVMGDTCTRACAFCNVRTGQPEALDASEPQRVADAVAKLGLRHVVITSVDRDDLADGGAARIAAVIRAIRAAAPGTTVEVLTPDSCASLVRPSWWLLPARTCSTTISKLCHGSTPPFGPARVTSSPSACSIM